jgi:hypothetical protein
VSYATEHRRMSPLLALARTLDIATNRDPQAIFEAGTAGFQIWCTEEDHPQGWDDLPMNAGAFGKPCEYVASVGWGWEGEQITLLLLSTDGYALSDHDHRQGKGKPYHAYRNRGQDVAWAIEKIEWLCARAGMPLPEIRIEED